MFEFLRLHVKAFISDEQAVSALEYAIIAVLILGAIVLAIKGAEINTLFTSMKSVIGVANSVSLGS